MFFYVVFGAYDIHSQPLCTSTSAPTPQIGAHISPQFSNLYKQASVNDKHGEYFKNGTASIGDDGWPIDGVNHEFRFYWNEVLPRLFNGDIVKVKFKGNISQAGRGVEACQTRNIIALPGGFVSFEVLITNENNGNGFVFELKNRCTDIQMMRPGYEFDDPRYLTDDYVKHTAHWAAFRFMGMLSAPSNFGQTWAKRVSSNAPANINTFQWSAPNCDNLKPTFKRFSEDITPAIVGGGDGMWSPGAPWETCIDICNYLNKDMWITIPTMADDNYVLQLSKLIKSRLKPTLNVNVEIGNELWNTGPPFMGFYMVRQMLEDEFKSNNSEKLKILGGSYCPGCDLEAADPGRNRNACGYDDYGAMQRWMARRLKEMMEQFAVDWGWKAEGGVGSRIRATLAGQVGYAWEGHGWNIRAGIEFLSKAYGPESVSKYLYSTSVAAYFKPGEPDGGFTQNLGLDKMAQNYSTYPMKYIFAEFANEKWNNFGVGNQVEGVFGLARMYGLKMYAYEGGNEIGNGGDGGANGWKTYDNGMAALKDARFGNVNTDLLNTWFSWFGYDALFMKNGDFVGDNNAYGISETLNENNTMRQSYIKVATSPAPPLSKVRGGVIGVPAITVLDARKFSSYMEYWNEGLYGIRHKGYSTVANTDYTLKSNDNFQPPMIIRCEKTGTYKLELERSQMGGAWQDPNPSKVEDDKFPTYCDIYLNEKLIKSGVRFGLKTFSRQLKDATNAPFYWWTEPVEIDIPYGVHALRVRPSLPTAARSGNLPAVFNGDMGRRFTNQIELMAYRFTLSSELPPVQPKDVLGDLEVCKGNNKARYEVGENDGSVCEYEWSGIPATAKLQPAVLVAGSSPARYTSGPKAYKTFIDWATTPPGSYELSVMARNQKSDGTWQESPKRTFKVVIKNCGFEFNPNPVCLNQEVIFTPIAVPNAKEYQWDNGKFGQSNATRFSTLSSATTYKATYDTPGDYTVNLKVTDNVDNVFFYSNKIVAVSCNSPIVVTPVVYCLGETALQLTATPSGTGEINSLKWYTSATGGTGSATGPTPDASKVDTVFYYVTQMNNSGNDESARSKIEVRVNPKPVAPIVSLPNLLQFCVGATATEANITSKINYASGVVTVAKWYTSPTATTSLAAPTAPNTATANTQSWYVTQSIGTCESPKSAELKVSVVPGPQFTVEPKDPLTCGQKGKLILKGLTASTKYTVSYGTPTITGDSTASAAGEIVLNVPQGTYNNIKVVFAGCSSVVASATNKITEPASPVYTVEAVQPLECGAQGSLAFKGLKPSTTYQVSYNGLAKQSYATQADGSFKIDLPKGTYNNVKVSLGLCTTSNSNSFTLQDKDLIPPVEQIGPSTYCQNQIVNLTDLTDRVKKEPNFTFKWYATPTSTPTAQPSEVNTTEAGSKTIYVSKTNAAGCESPQLELNIVINASSTLAVAATDPSACGNLDGQLLISGLKNVVNYTIEYKKEGQSQPIKSSFSDAQGKIVIGNLTAGNYSSITVTPVSGASCFTNSTTELKLKEPLAPELSPVIAGAKDYCAGEPIAALTTAAQSGGVIEWYADVALTNKVGDGISYTPTTVTGTTTFYAVENVGGGCKSPAGKASITIVSSPITQSIVGTGGAASCNDIGYPLTLKTTEIGVNYQLYKDNVAAGAPQLGTGAGLKLATLSTAGTYTATASSAVNNCPALVTGSLVITPSVNPQPFAVSGGATGCEGSATAADILLSGSEANVTYTLLPANIPLEGTGTALTYPMEAKKINNGNYTISATNDLNGCNADMTGKAEVNIQAGVGAPVLTADASYCNQGTSQIKVVATNADSQLWSISPATAGTIDAATGNISWLASYSGPVTIKVEVSNSACSTASKSATKETKTAAKPVLNLVQGDSLVCRGTEAIYQALPKSAGITYNWQTASSGSISILENDQAGTIKLKYNEDLSKEGAIITVTPISEICGAGTPVTKQVNKDPSCDLYVPNILTIKDKESTNAWHIEGVENYPKMSIQIFNRWGAEVHSHNGKYEKPWDGSTNSGQPLPTATYYYVIDKQDGSKTITGSVTVVRD